MWWAAAVNYLSQPPKGGTVYASSTTKAIGLGAAVAIAGGLVLLAYTMKGK